MRLSGRSQIHIALGFLAALIVARYTIDLQRLHCHNAFALDGASEWDHIHAYPTQSKETLQLVGPARIQTQPDHDLKAELDTLTFRDILTRDMHKKQVPLVGDPKNTTIRPSLSEGPSSVTPKASQLDILKVWEAAVAKAEAHVERSYTDTCSLKRVACNLRHVGPAGYIYYLADLTASVTTTGNVGTYYDYALASVLRLSKMTDFPILLLVANSTWKSNEILVNHIQSVASNVFLTVVDDTFYMRPLARYGVRHTRGKLRHAYGTIQVFNPQATGMFMRAAFVDVDTFVLTNIDEVFCSTKFSASERPSTTSSSRKRGVRVKGFRQPSGTYNGGFFVFKPSQETMDRFIAEMLKQMQQPGEKKFAMQQLLHVVYPADYVCLSHNYNCMGIRADISPVSSKCQVLDEADVFAKVKVLHGKFSSDVFEKALPRIHEMWKESNAEALTIARRIHPV